MNRSRSRGAVLGFALLVALGFAPQVGRLVHVDTSIISEVLLTAIAAMAVNLLLGYIGLNAFGTASFFGLGAYGAALSIANYHVGFVTALLVGTIAALLGACVIAPFLLRRRGIYFALLFIAFGQVFYFLAYRFSNITGGEDGMSFPRPPLHLGPLHRSVDELGMYYVTYSLFVLSTIVMWLLVRSPFGRTLNAIRQNELRVRYLGLNTDRFIFVGILVAAVFSGIGGALYGLLLRFAFPLLLDWHQSGDFVLMTILGGSGTIFGPLLGALIFVLGKDIISTITPLWQIFLGGFFVICVLGFPKGIVGTIGDLIARRAASPVLAEENALDVSVLGAAAREPGVTEGTPRRRP
ncbi:MAG TPA: branched-chain amino acid ABC transporter permease [Candidatus Baltobacteraceae bacterium]|jgi:branched-chain amino acid transport system permease protein|nr:branched-chain amino acid ABC transporter permease [Candidatus Baltobacteraceae bacterium]